MQDGLQAVDTAGQWELSHGCWTEDYDAASGSMGFTIALSPVTGDLPAGVTLAPMIAHNPCWNPAERLYDPTLAKPEGVIGSGQYDLSRSVVIRLEVQ